MSEFIDCARGVDHRLISCQKSRHSTFTSVTVGRWMLAVMLTQLFYTAAVHAESIERPNIIFIMADDLGYGDLGCYGQQHIQTPHIDRLATEGRRFTDCYSGSTVCAPTRCVLMTGLHTGHCRVRSNSSSGGRVPLRDSDVTVAEVLKPTGYRTGITGKWGLGEPGTAGVPNRQGFDRWLGFLNQRHAHTYYPEYIWRDEDIFVLECNRGRYETEWVHDLFTDFCLDFIKQNRSDPFFLYVAYTIPHGRLEVPDLKPYANRDWPETAKQYASMITKMDTDVGRIMTLLGELGLDERTIVFFTSDNGAEPSYFRKTDVMDFYEETFNSNGPFRGYKRNLTEGGIRVPMIVRWPGRVPAGSTSDFPWAFWDVLPTCADLAGVKPPADIDGISVLPTLLGESQQPHEFLYWESYGGGLQQAVRHDQWKALRKNVDVPLQLYDVVTDPAEEHDIAKQHPDVVREIEDYLKTARTPSPFWPKLTDEGREELGLE